MFDAEKAHSEYKKDNMDGKKDNQDTSMGKLCLKKPVMNL